MGQVLVFELRIVRLTQCRQALQVGGNGPTFEVIPDFLYAEIKHIPWLEELSRLHQSLSQGTIQVTRQPKRPGSCQAHVFAMLYR